MEGTIGYVKKEHLIERQSRAEREMLRELENGDYTVEKPLVKYNPYFISPLSAVVLFRTERETAVTVRVIGKTENATYSHTFPRSRTHVLPVLGLYSSWVNTVEIEEYRGRKTEVRIEVPDVFGGESVIDYMKTTPEYLGEDCVFLSPAGKGTSTAFDFNGDARWRLDIPCPFDIKRLRNGNILMCTDRMLREPYYMSGLYEMSPVGKIYREYRVPGGAHHDAFEMPDGNLLCLTGDLRSDTVEDMCVLLSRETGKALKMWDMKDLMDPERIGKSGSWTRDDWFHANAVWYDANTDSITISGRHADAIVNIDAGTGELKWIIGDSENWGEEYKKYFFTPVGKNFKWQYEQHSCVVTPDGDVMCFDNHHFGSKNPAEYVPAAESLSRGVRYRVNTEDMTIEQVWEYGRERGPVFFSPYISNVEYYGEGWYMVHSGGISLDEYGRPSEALGSSAAAAGYTQSSVTVELRGGREMLEMKVPGNYYRAEKMPLYCCGNNLSAGDGEVLGRLDETRETELKEDAEDRGEAVPSSCGAVIEEESDMVTFLARFNTGDMVTLLLEGEEGRHGYYISTTYEPPAAMSCGTFRESGFRDTVTCVTKTGLSGAYDVRVIINGRKYGTGVRITCAP